MRRAVLRTLAYADVFEYVLTAQQVHEYLVELECPLEAVEAFLAHPNGAIDQVLSEGGWYGLSGRQDLFETRRRRALAAKEMWKQARTYGRLLSHVPYVRMVAVTGALAVDNTEADDDVDYLIVTAPRRLWLCRGMVVVLVRWAAARGCTVCPNYLLTENELRPQEQNLFTAHEIVQAVPLYGVETYKKMRRENQWVRRYLPNAPSLHPAVRECYEPGRTGRRAKRVGEQLLSGKLGERMEAWEYGIKSAKLREQAGTAARYVCFTPDVCKGHLSNHGGRAMKGYAERVAQLEQSADSMEVML